MFISLRNSPNNWLAKKISQQSNMAIPVSNMYSKTGTNRYARKIKHIDRKNNSEISSNNEYFNIKF